MVESNVCISIASMAEAVIKPRCGTFVRSDIAPYPPRRGTGHGVFSRWDVSWWWISIHPMSLARTILVHLDDA
jgi:hypothetical protein